MPEPTGAAVGVGGDALLAEGVRVLLLPALAWWAEDGVRLGKGGGYYDRLLAGPAPAPARAAAGRCGARRRAAACRRRPRRAARPRRPGRRDPVPGRPVALGRSRPALVTGCQVERAVGPAVAAAVVRRHPRIDLGRVAHRDLPGPLRRRAEGERDPLVSCIARHSVSASLRSPVRWTASWVRVWTATSSPAARRPSPRPVSATTPTAVRRSRTTAPPCGPAPHPRRTTRGRDRPSRR